MDHSEFAAQKVRETYPEADIIPDNVDAFFTATELAAAVGVTRAKLIAAIRRRRIAIHHVTASGHPLFPVRELPQYQAAYFSR